MAEEIYSAENGKYLKDNPTWHVEDSPWKAKQVLKMLDRNPLDLKTIAEVGCGVGEILNQLHQSMRKNIEFVGYDISTDAIRVANSRKKDRLSFMLDDFLKTESKYDLLLMMDVFEHVEDYIGFLKSCSEKTKYAIFHVPLDIDILGLLRNVPIKNRALVGHLHYFTKSTALATISDSGYNILDYFYTPGMLEAPNRKFKSKVAAIPRRLLFSLNKNFAVTLLGGYSLLVLAESKK